MHHKAKYLSLQPAYSLKWLRKRNLQVCWPRREFISQRILAHSSGGHKQGSSEDRNVIGWAGASLLCSKVYIYLFKMHWGVATVAQWKRIWPASMRTQVQSLASLNGWRIRVAVSCGVLRKRSLDLAWLWHRLAATAPIQPLTWKTPSAVDAALKDKKVNK